ncbi:APC family permease [Brevibacillus borstelensis]|uniref:APC family permease n=1 Tax=Brevibacillus borstelensis TaxID=45462 RepID=UPI0030C3A494
MENGTIRLPHACALYIAAILGSGVLFLSGSTADAAGPASLIAWAGVIALSFPLAYAFAALSRMYPDAGGAATFVKMAFGPKLGGLIGWCYFFCATAGQMIVSLTGAYYVSSSMGWGRTGMLLVALLTLVIAGTVNVQGVKISGRLSLLLSSLLLALLLAVIVLTLPRLDISRFAPFAPHGVASVGTAATMILWSFFGWEAICSLSHQFYKPERTIVRSTVISAAVIGVLFLALSVVTIGTGTYGDDERNLSPVGIMMQESLGVGAQIGTGFLALIICLGTCNAFVASLGQLGYALARDGVFPRLFVRLHPRKGTPVLAIASVVMLAAVGVTFTVILSIPFDKLLLIPNSLGLTVYIISMAAGVKLFNRLTLPWWSSLLSLLLCLCLLPFFGRSLLAPAAMAAAYLLFVRSSRQRPSVRA